MAGSSRRYSEEELRELFANSDSEDSENGRLISEDESSSDDNSDIEVHSNKQLIDELTGEDAPVEFRPRPIGFGKGRGRPGGAGESDVQARAPRGRGRGAVGDEKWNDRPGNLTSKWLPEYHCESPGKPVNNTSNYVPLDFFIAVFPEEVIETIVRETNRYFEQFKLIQENAEKSVVREWYDTSVPEMKAFLGLLILMGLDRSSSYKTHWNTDPLLDRPGFRAVMGRNRFLTILRFLHLSDNSLQPQHDRSYKVRTILEGLIQAWNSVFHMEKEVSVDECMVAFKGRVSFLQYIKSKPTKWGMKGWVLAGSKTGYVYNWKLYTGKETAEASKNLGFRVVTELTADLKEGQIVFADNFFTSVELFLNLQDRGIGACGTVKCNRAGNPVILKQFKHGTNKKKLQELSPVFMFHELQYLMAVGWYDKRPVCLLSTVDDLGTSQKRIRTKDGVDGYRQIVKPLAIENYNQHMGGVDQSDQMNSYYSLSHRSMKWWKKVFCHLLVTAVSNAFILHKSSAAPKITSFEFRLQLVHGLVSSYQRPSISQQGRPSNRADPPNRLNGQMHFMEKTDGKPDCKVCTIRSAEKKYIHRKQTRRQCKTCTPKIPLCDVPCFEIYHSIADYKSYWQRHYNN